MISILTIHFRSKKIISRRHRILKEIVHFVLTWLLEDAFVVDSGFKLKGQFGCKTCRIILLSMVNYLLLSVIRQYRFSFGTVYNKSL